jgi:HK97 family phage prohead protease
MSELLIQRDLGGLEPTGDGWTLYGLAVPYERDQRVSDDGSTFYLERFAAGAYARDVAKGGRWVNLFVGHGGDEGDRFLGRCIGLRESDGLYAEVRLNREHQLAEQARSGELTGWSVSARVYRSRETKSPSGQRLVVREVCGLSHIAATPVPQYVGAGVIVARDHQFTGPQAAPRREQLRARLAALRPSQG